MAAKRTASSELNHDNWNDEEAPEVSGTFKRAPEDALKNRIIKTARRRNPISRASEESDSSKNLFSNITFSKTSSTASSQAFSFLSNLSTQSTLSIPSASQPAKAPASSTPVKSGEKSNHYLSKLKGLNETVSKWVKQHVDENPLVNLQPIFDEYKRYFEELDKAKDSSSEHLEKDKKSDDDGSAKKDDVSDNKDGAKSTPTFSFGQTNKTPSFNFSAPATSKPFSFGANTATTSSFKFTPYQSTSTTTAPTNGFSFSAPSTTAAPATTDSTAVNGDNEEEDTPPKVEFTPVIEKEHIYTIRCKVFVKKDGQFGDRGVGNLFLKKIENSEKMQLIVRADTNLGNLLCNFILSEGIPTQRMGKKDVMLVCLPTPDFKPPPVPVLLRVKSPEEADTLLETLEKYKK